MVKLIVLILSVFFYLHVVSGENSHQDLLSLIGKELVKDPLVKNIDLNQYSLILNRTIQPDLQNHLEKLLKRYRPYYASIVIIDNNDGSILAANGFNHKKLSPQTIFTATHPAASLIKVVTAASVLESEEFSITDRIAFKGRGSTLYRSQLGALRKGDFRKVSLKGAFAFSNNVVFGRLATQKLSSFDFYHMALKFGFNAPLIDYIPSKPSMIKFPIHRYNFAELASGYNRETLISPLHAAMIPMVIVNDGEMLGPKLINSIVDERGFLISKVSKPSKQIFSKETATELYSLMQDTVSYGTARGAFRRYAPRVSKKLEIGGKTGTITGGKPYGRRDWFVGFARPGHSQDKGISIAVMQVNRNGWKIRSSLLAKLIFQYYYKNGHFKYIADNDGRRTNKELE